MILELDGRDKKGPIHMRLEFENQFDLPGRWLRGNLHCHVSNMGEPAEVCKRYRELGFDFLAATDHDDVTPMPASSEEFVTICGAEVGGGGPHIPCVGLHENVRPADGSVEDIARLVKDVEAQGGVAILAHPYWSGLGGQRLRGIAQAGMVGMELSNRTCWRINGKARAEALWQLLLSEGIFLAAVGVDDSHGFNELVTGRTWTGALVRAATPEGVVEAIRSHRTYASEGPVIKAIRIEERGVVAVDCSPCLACHFMSRGSGVRTAVSEEPSEHFEIDLAIQGYRLREWLSVCLEDELGRRAWSSAIRVQNEITRLYDISEG